MLISKPDASEYPPYYTPYIQQAEDTDLITALKKSEKELIELIHLIPEDLGDYRYEREKWSIKEVLIHLNDAERVFAYRALRFARNDKTELAGFDENAWVPESNAHQRTLKDILKEHAYVRQGTISLFENITDQMALRKGLANGKEISVRALGFIICGHAVHHARVVRERYLKSKNFQSS
jgi:hypothetical protein